MKIRALIACAAPHSTRAQVAIVCAAHERKSVKPTFKLNHKMFHVNSVGRHRSEKWFFCASNIIEPNNGTMITRKLRGNNVFVLFLILFKITNE